MTPIAQHLQEKEIEDLKATFLEADVNNDGTLTFDEIKSILAQHNVEVMNEMEQVMKDIDSDKSGVIEYTEFLAATMDRKQYIKRETCWQAVQEVDLNGDGNVDFDEFMQMMTSKTGFVRGGGG